MPYRTYRAPISPPQRRNVLLGGALLAGSAGFVNAVLLSFFRVPVSHMSGAVAHVGVGLGGRSLGEAAGALTIIGAFFFGSTVSGAIVGRDTALPGRRYGVLLVIESVALGAAGSCLYARLSTGVPLAAFACGLQNAMSSSYYGLALRTTHVTGMVTDLGVIVGQWLRHRRIPRWKALLLTVLASAFLVGGVVGAASVRWLDYRVLYVPAVGTLAAGVAYFLRASRRVRRQRAATAAGHVAYSPRGRRSGSEPAVTGRGGKAPDMES
ncbi:MAG: YoaK family protein [Gemmatimonadaceae bacterium]